LISDAVGRNLPGRLLLAARRRYCPISNSTLGCELLPDVETLIEYSFDMFVTEINASGSARVFSTFIGGSGSESGRGIAVDRLGIRVVCRAAAQIRGIHQSRTERIEFRYEGVVHGGWTRRIPG
jgi:hypothetical protein